MKNNSKMKLSQFKFERVFNIQPFRNHDGSIYKYTSYERYENKKGLKLHRYGKGLFCKFKIPIRKRSHGVYLYVVDGNLKYIGECENLETRFNNQYGNISPRNCYKGGQQTNCRINHLILEAVKKGSIVSIYFIETKYHKRIEAKLRSSYRPPWNRI